MFVAHVQRRGYGTLRCDRLNALIWYSVLLKAVPRIPYLEGCFDFKHVDEIAAVIVTETGHQPRGH